MYIIESRWWIFGRTPCINLKFMCSYESWWFILRVLKQNVYANMDWNMFMCWRRCTGRALSLYHFHICDIPRGLDDFLQIGLVLEGRRCKKHDEKHMKIARMLYLLAKAYIGIMVNLHV
jgi:hypothetical protein